MWTWQWMLNLWGRVEPTRVTSARASGVGYGSARDSELPPLLLSSMLPLKWSLPGAVESTLHACRMPPTPPSTPAVFPRGSYPICTVRVLVCQHLCPRLMSARKGTSAVSSAVCSQDQELCWAQRSCPGNLGWMKPAAELKFCLSKMIKQEPMVPIDAWPLGPFRPPQLPALCLVPAWKWPLAGVHYTWQSALCRDWMLNGCLKVSSVKVFQLWQEMQSWF